MLKLGQWNLLSVSETTAEGLLLDGGDLGTVLLPKRFAMGLEEETELNVFVYLNSDDRYTATTKPPLAVAGEFAGLTCVQTTNIGAFVDLGLEKDLLVPFSEQKDDLYEAETYLTYIYVDPKSNRLVGSTKVDRWLKDTAVSYFEDQEVELMIANQTDIGYKAIINHTDWGLLYHEQVFQDLRVGQKLVGYIFKNREDGKIDLTLHPPAEQRTKRLATTILEELQEVQTLPFSDKSSSEIIQAKFNESKKTFKKAVGYLYKNKLIEITPTSIRLLTHPEK